MIGRLRLALALAWVALATAVLVPPQMLAMRTGWWSENAVRGLWHRIVVRALGFRVHVTGALATERPLLVCCNHVSWTDISVLASLYDLSFIAKADLNGWPVLGRLFRLQRAIYVEREARRRSGEQAETLASRLTQGDAIVLFPEGSTDDGNLLLPFKSTLFAAAGMAAARHPGKAIHIQPAAICYARLHGLPMGRMHRPVAAWIGDEDFIPHVGRLLRSGGFDVEVRFGEPIAFPAGTERKAMAARVEAEVRALFAQTLCNPAGGRGK